MINKFVNYIRGKLSGLERKNPDHIHKDSNLIQKDSSKSTSQDSTTSQSTTKRKYRRPRVEKVKSQKVWELSQFEVPPAEGKTRFHDFQLPLCLMHAIADLNFMYCTPVQANTLEATLSGTDAIGQAQTGTGKTAAFLVTILSKLMDQSLNKKRKKGTPRALIIAPTRELVMQVANDGRSLAKHTHLSIVSVFGGMDYEKQQQALEQRPVDIVVATPGRLLDFQRKGIVNLRSVEFLVIDEADRMLDMGFIPDVTKIVLSTPPKEKRQTLMFSATMTSEVRRLAAKWCKNPINVEVEPEQVAVDTVNQIVYLTTAHDKYSVLYNLITKNNLKKVLVFTNRRDETRKLTDRLKRNRISCDMLSGEVAQKKRMVTLERFRNGQIKVLVATDVAGRGIHIDGITHVINYTLPYEPDDYVHRIGRTGRAGKEGIAISFADEEGAFYLSDIETYIGRKLECTYPDESLLEQAPRGVTPKPSTNKSPHYKSRKPHGQKHWSKKRKQTPSQSV